MNMDDLKGAQSEINCHTSMLIKAFKIGNSWNHISRVRETMLGEGLSTWPLSLLYKDHKGWTPDIGGCPPTRPVAGGHLGMNLHISEIISEIIEPLVDTFDGGREVISTEDLLARIEKVNQKMKGWSKYSWWDGQTWENFVACGSCVGDEKVKFDENQPELCGCVGVETMLLEENGLSKMDCEDVVTRGQELEGIIKSLRNLGGLKNDETEDLKGHYERKQFGLDSS